MNLSNHTRATLWMISSCVAFALLWVLIRLASERMHAFDIAAWRAVMGLMWLLPMIVTTPGLLKLSTFPTHLRRATSGIIATFAIFYAVANAPLANVMAINYSAPLFATIGAMLFLGERVGRFRGTTLLVGFLGVLLVLRPGFTEITPGLAAAVLAAIGTAFSLVSIKKLTGIDDSRSVAAWCLIIMTPACFILGAPWVTWPDQDVWPILIALGAVTAVGQISLAKAFSLADASAMMPYDFVRFGLVVSAGILLFGEAYDLLTIAGGSIILLAAITLAVREKMLRRKAIG